MLHQHGLALEWCGQGFPALQGRLPLEPEVLQALLVKVSIAGVKLDHACRQSLRNGQIVARIELDMRVAGCVHIALGAVEAAGHFQHVHIM